jgi:cobalt-precorrin-5B (C1)-methyltransferase
MRFLKYGISTGACAAAAAKAALLTLLDRPVEHVGVPTPIGLRLEVPIKGCRRIDSEKAVAWVVKDAGDDVDVTGGIEISATVRLLERPWCCHKGWGGRGHGDKARPASSGGRARNKPFSEDDDRKRCEGGFASWQRG